MTPRDAATSPKRARRAVEWDEANLAKNFAERSATMKIEEIETPWHSPPRELFHDLRAEDEEALTRRERAHEEVMRRLDALIRADARGETTTTATTTTRDADATMRDEGSEEGTTRVAFHDPSARDEDFEDDAEEVVKKRLFDAKRKAFQCKGRATERFLADEGGD